MSISWQHPALMRCSTFTCSMHRSMLCSTQRHPAAASGMPVGRHLHGHIRSLVAAAGVGQGPDKPSTSGSDEGNANKQYGPHSKQAGGSKPRDTPDRSTKRGANAGGAGARKGLTNASAPHVQVRVPVPAGRLTPTAPIEPLKAALLSKLKKQMAPWIKDDGSSAASPSVSRAAPELAALEQALQSMSPQQLQEWLQDASEQQDAVLEEQLQQLSPEEMRKLIESLSEPTLDPAYWQANMLKPVMQDALREELGPEMSALMDKLLGPGWREAERPDYLQLPPAVIRKKVQALSPEEQELLPQLFKELGDTAVAYDYVGQYKERYEAMEADDKRRREARLRLRRKMAAQRTEQESAAASSPQQETGLDAGSAGQDAGEQDDEEGGEEEELAEAGNPGARSSRQGDELNLKQVALASGLTPEVASLVERLYAVVQRYDPETGPGWIEEGHAGGPEMQAIKRAAVVLARVASITSMEDLQAADLSPAELAGAAEDALSDIQDLLDMQDTLQEPAARATLAFITTQLLVEDEADGSQRTLPVDEATTDKLLEFAAAAESWVALHAFMDSWDKRHSDVLRVRAATMALDIGRAEDELWWAKLEDEMSEPERALLSLKRLALGLPEPDPDDEAIDILNEVYKRLKANPPGSQAGASDGKSRLSEEGASGHRDPREQEAEAKRAASRDARRLLALPNWERIKTVGALDAGVLKGMDELDAQGYNEEVLMKWSLHPIVGPRLMSGQPLIKPDEVPPDMAELLREAEGWEMEGLDYKVETKSLAPDRKERAQLVNYYREQLRSAQVQMARVAKGTGVGARMSTGGSMRAAAARAAMSAADGGQPGGDGDEDVRSSKRKPKGPKSDKGFGKGSSRSGLGGRLKKLGRDSSS